MPATDTCATHCKPETKRKEETAATLGFVHACRSVKLLTDDHSDFAAV